MLSAELGMGTDMLRCRTSDDPRYFDSGVSSILPPAPTLTSPPLSTSPIAGKLDSSLFLPPETLSTPSAPSPSRSSSVFDSISDELGNEDSCGDDADRTSLEAALDVF